MFSSQDSLLARSLQLQKCAGLLVLLLASWGYEEKVIFARAVCICVCGKLRFIRVVPREMAAEKVCTGGDLQ